jgi:ELWxxDGT repeat protein
VTPGRLFFSGCTPDAGCEPWVSDGTATATRRLRDLTPGTYGSARGSSRRAPEGLTPFAGRIWFGADDGVAGREPWNLPLE